MKKERKLSNLLLNNRDKKRALPAFNVSSFDSINAISRASKENNLPCIIQFSEKIISKYKIIYLKNIFDFIKKYHNSEIFLHLDHCKNIKIIRKCIDSGFDMVMFDGSNLPIEQNITFTKEVLKYAHSKNICLEAEIGGIGGQEDGFESCGNYALKEDIEKMCSEANMDCLAIGFGNIHGNYNSKSSLNWSILEYAHEVTSTPLVLHGGTGLTDDEFIKAINFGCSKINLSTVLKNAYQETLEYCQKDKSFKDDPSIFHTYLDSRIFNIASEYLIKFNENKI